MEGDGPPRKSRRGDGAAPCSDPLAFLLSLNLACAAREKAGKPITPPGLPLPVAEHAAFITADCIRVDGPASS
jgi:hypothetical protein